MKKMVLFLTVLVFLVSAFPGTTVSANDNSLILDARTRVALRAAELAVKSMPGKYSWEEGRTCSSFVSEYLRHLSFPVDGLNGQYAEYPDPFPWSGELYQIDWVRKNYPEYLHSAPLNDLLNGKLWNQIHPGDVIYLQTAVGHNGYNSYYHTVVLVGYLADGSPQFAEIAGGMDNASANRTFAQTMKFYKVRADGTYDIKPYVTGLPAKFLLVTWFDPLAILNGGGLWMKPGKVMPTASYLEVNDFVVTVNIHDGTTAIFEKKVDDKKKVVWEPVTLGGVDEFYAVTGRRLPANNRIAVAFEEARPNEIYDGDFGVYISKHGVYQHTWTPQMAARLDEFQYVAGFGGLDGNTDTSILMPQVRGPYGNILDYYDWSRFTIHQTPDVKNQEIWLRNDLLIKANWTDHAPIPVPQVYLSSGCVNYDPQTWVAMKGFLKPELSGGKKIAVLLSYKDFDQELLLTIGQLEAPFTANQWGKWCGEGNDKCDGVDRRNYRKTYLD